jgi:hypothetical protein
MEFSAHEIWLRLNYAVKKKREALLAEPSLISDQKKLILLNSCDAVFVRRAFV